MNQFLVNNLIKKVAEAHTEGDYIKLKMLFKSYMIYLSVN